MYLKINRKITSHGIQVFHYLELELVEWDSKILLHGIYGFSYYKCETYNGFDRFSVSVLDFYLFLFISVNLFQNIINLKSWFHIPLLTCPSSFHWLFGSVMINTHSKSQISRKARNRGTERKISSHFKSLQELS